LSLQRPPVVLLGLMGSGKSTIGNRLAQSLDWAFCDTDREIERSTGADIPWIFEKEGEAGFRRREHAALCDALLKTNTVISTGGGVVELEQNRQRLAESDAWVVYLAAPPKVLFARVGQDASRPLLAQGDALGTLSTLHDRRDPLYRALADCVIQTDRLSPKLVLNEILEKQEEAACKK